MPRAELPGYCVWLCVCAVRVWERPRTWCRTDCRCSVHECRYMCQLDTCATPTLLQHYAYTRFIRDGDGCYGAFFPFQPLVRIECVFFYLYSSVVGRGRTLASHAKHTFNRNVLHTSHPKTNDNRTKCMNAIAIQLGAALTKLEFIQKIIRIKLIAQRLSVSPFFCSSGFRLTIHFRRDVFSSFFDLFSLRHINAARRTFSESLCVDSQWFVGCCTPPFVTRSLSHTLSVALSDLSLLLIVLFCFEACGWSFSVKWAK